MLNGTIYTIIISALAHAACGTEVVAPPEPQESEPEEEAPSDVALINNADWVPADDDPGALLAHRPEVVECEAAALVVVDAALDIDTGGCNYVALEQRTLAAVPAGASIEVSLFHLALYDPASVRSTGHAVLAVDGEVIWERTVDIPADSAAFLDQVILDRAIRQDSILYFHLHNHGSNEWKLLSVVHKGQPADP